MLLVHREALFINLSFQTCSNPFTCLTAQISGAVKCMIYSHGASGNTVIYFQPAAKELPLFFSLTSHSVKGENISSLFPTTFGNLHFYVCKTYIKISPTSYLLPDLSGEFPIL